MPRLYLVRHGEAAAGWGEDADPGLSDRGRSQAEAVAQQLGPLGPLPIIVSPLRRCRETAAPLEALWDVEARVVPAVGEIESPSPLEDRATWLRGVMSGSWSDVGDHEPWRRGVVDALLALDEDTVVVSHFIAINVAVGAASGRDEVVCFTPGNCSLTVLSSAGGALTVEELGGQAHSSVL